MVEKLAEMMVDAMAMTKAQQLVATMVEKLDIGTADNWVKMWAPLMVATTECRTAPTMEYSSAAMMAELMVETMECAKVDYWEQQKAEKMEY